MKKMDWATWNQPTNSAGSIPLSLQVTEKWTWGSRAFSVRAVWPTVPMTSPQETMSPGSHGCLFRQAGIGGDIAAGVPDYHSGSHQVVVVHGVNRARQRRP